MTRFTLALAVVSALGLTAVALADPSSQAPIAPVASTLPAASGSCALPSTGVEATPMSAAPVFQGCWTQFPTGTCRAVYQVGTAYKLCGACGRTGTPPAYSASCTTISSYTLGTGYWCS